jgi:hypothetical protein
VKHHIQRDLGGSPCTPRAELLHQQERSVLGIFPAYTWGSKHLRLAEDISFLAYRLQHTIYITKACIVSVLVVLKKFAFPSPISVPSWKFSMRFFRGTPNVFSTVGSGILETAENIAAKTTACNDGRGSSFLETSAQKASYRFSKLGRWTTLATGWTASQYRCIRVSDASFDGRKSIRVYFRELSAPKKRSERGAINDGPGSK